MGKIKDLVEEVFYRYRDNAISLKELMFTLYSYTDTNIRSAGNKEIFDECFEKEFNESGNIRPKISAKTLITLKKENFIFTNDSFAPDCVCGSKVYYLNIRRCHYWVCDKCKKYTYFGSNLLGSWRNENNKTWKRNKEKLSKYKEVSN